MNRIVVGVADCKWSANESDELVSYALGSSVALVVHDPVVHAGGLLHFLLPASRIDRDKAARNPFMFADTGVPECLQRMGEYGGQKHRLRVAVVGAAQVADEDGLFKIGKRNYLAVRKALWRAGLMIQAEDVGGAVSRTVRLEIVTGRVVSKSPAGPERDVTPSGRERGGRKWGSNS